MTLAPENGYDQSTFVAGLNAYKRHVHKTAVEHGWWENGDRNMGEVIALMHSELSEALEAWRDGNEPMLHYTLTADEAKPLGMVGPQNWEGPPSLNADDGSKVLGKPEGLASEFADTIIRILDVCERNHIPITRALVDKAAYNETRPYRHGGKLA